MTGDVGWLGTVELGSAGNIGSSPLITSKKTLASLFAAASLGVTILASAAPAEAGWRHRGYGGAVAAGVIGGLAIGAIAASSRPAYAEPVYVEAPECYVVRRRVVNAFGEVMIRREQVCE